jgi:hypothetical protein
MSDIAPAPTTDAPTDQTDSEPDTGDQGPDLASEVEKWKAQARKHEERAKANAKAAQELDEFRKQSMSETEKAIEEARTAGRQQALTEAGAKIAAAELRAAAAGRMTGEQVDTLVDGLNLARFVGDDGEVNRDAVVQFVDGIAPQRTEPASLVDLGQGARNPQNMPLNGDPVERALKDALGIR